MRLTKPQRKAQLEIESWIKTGKPDLTTKYILDNYIPCYDPAMLGEFHTPLVMAEYVANLLFFENGAKILDPCAGIGSLLYPLTQQFNRLEFEAVELVFDSAQIFQKLFPNIEFKYSDAFLELRQLEGSFGYVLMNPPFNVMADMSDALEVCESGAKKSQHLFLELAIRVLKPGGQALVIGPSNLIDQIPKEARAWFDDNMELEYEHEKLPGKFKQAILPVNLFVFRSIRKPIQKEELELVRQVVEQEYTFELGVYEQMKLI